MTWFGNSYYFVYSTLRNSINEINNNKIKDSNNTHIEYLCLLTLSANNVGRHFDIILSADHARPWQVQTLPVAKITTDVVNLSSVPTVTGHVLRP